MENATKNSSFVNSAWEYLKLRWEIYSLLATIKVAELFSSFLTVFVVILIAGITVLFLSFSAAYFIGNRLNDTALGFLIVAGFYVLLVLLVILIKGKLIKRPIENSIIKLILKKPD